MAQSNQWYDSSGYPGSHAQGSSQQARAEFDSIEAMALKLPDLLGHGLEIVRVNAGGTALESVEGSGSGAPIFTTSPTLVTPILGVASATSINKVTITQPATGATLTLADGSTFVTAGAFSVTFTATAATTLTLPLTGTLATLAGSEAFTNKTLTAPVLSGSVTGTYTLAGTPTITGPAISAPVLSGAITGSPTLDSTTRASLNLETIYSYTEYLTNTGLGNAIPADDTIPQIGEGTQILVSSAIVPKSANSRVCITVDLNGSNDTNTSAIVAALFKVGTANALKAKAQSISTAGEVQNLSIYHEEAAGSTASRTYSVRVGPATGGQNVHLNGNSGATLFGGVEACTLKVQVLYVD